MPDEFDPMDGLSNDDREYLQRQREAFSRQKSVHDRFSGDDDRAAAAEAHRRSVMGEARLRGGPSAPVNGGPARATTGTYVSSSPPQMFSVLRADPGTDEVDSLPATREKYAPDWKHMKAQIASHDGTWIVSRHEFPAHVAFILGFFGKDGWEPPPDSEKECFEVIVKDKRVFRTDPE